MISLSPCSSPIDLMEPIPLPTNGTHFSLPTDLMDSIPCVFSSSLERELRQSALVASSTLRPPFGTRSLTICAILNSPLVFLGTDWKPSFFPKFDAPHTFLDLVVHLLSFYLFFHDFIHCLPCVPTRYFISWRVRNVLIDWLIDSHFPPTDPMKPISSPNWWKTGSPLGQSFVGAGWYIGIFTDTGYSRNGYY